MDDNTKKLMLVSTVLGSLAALTFGYNYYGRLSKPIESEESCNVNKYETTIDNKIIKNNENEEKPMSFLSSLTQTIGFGNINKNTTKKEVSLELKEKKIRKKEDYIDKQQQQWPTFN